MGELAKDWFKNIDSGNKVRSQIAAFAQELQKFPSMTQIIRHHFGENLYGRELFLPAGTGGVGKIHRNQTLNFVLYGKCVVRTEEDPEITYQAPAVFFSGPGIAKAIYAITDCIFMNVHILKETTTDLRGIEKELICNSYEEMEAEWEAMGGRPETVAIQTTEVVEGEL